MKPKIHTLILLISLGMTGALSSAAAPGEPFLGAWNLTLPNGAAGWLGVQRQGDRLTAQLLWGGGSVLPVDDVSLEGETLVLKRVRKPPKGKGQAQPPKPVFETIYAHRDGKNLKMLFETRPEGGSATRSAFTGVPCPPPPARPDLSKAKFGEPIVLFNGTSLEGWSLLPPDRPNGWSAQNGELVNDPKQPEDGARLAYGNLRTDATFKDFNLKMEVNVPEKGNSGVYLRGIYEVQLSDAFGEEPSAHGMGGIYSRIAPRENASKPAGEWQTLDITLLDRHVTVVLNGKTILDNEPLPGCTGGALWSDPFQPGPIYLQGDHTAVRFRNLVLKPIE